MKKKSSKKEYSKEQVVNKVKEPSAVYKSTKSRENVPNTALKKEKKGLALKLKPMSIEELKEKIKQSEEDIKAGRIYSHDEVKAHFKNKFKVR
jgi:hypothetical protein